jgi:hypothetical protein
VLLKLSKLLIKRTPGRTLLMRRFLLSAGAHSQAARMLRKDVILPCDVIYRSLHAGHHADKR